MTEETEQRLDRLESLVEQQQDTIEAQQATIDQQRERIDDLDADGVDDLDADETDAEPPADGTRPAVVTRRGALTAGSLLALLFGGVGTASADTQGSVGTSSDPLNTLYADTLHGSSGTLTLGDDVDLGGNVLTDTSSDLTIQSASGSSLTLNTNGGDRALELGVPRTSGSNTAGGNVVAGHPNNTVNNSAVGTVIGGGGESNGNENTVGGNFAMVGGGRSNTASNDYATVGGGRSNTASGLDATVGGGESNTASGVDATVGGGEFNTANGFRATLGGGYNNTTGGKFATIGGGDSNTADGNFATVGGGDSNTASGDDATVGGGLLNKASGSRATVAGGKGNTADGDDSFAAGRRSNTNDNNGTFVWGDSTSNSVTADMADQVVFQAGGGMKVYTASDTSTGAELPAGSGSWSSLSTKTAKSDIESVSPSAVLNAVEELDVATWRYDAEAEGVRHMGPMAEAFHDAFGLGQDDQRIATVDADGVALAAIQGLSQRLDDAREALDAKDDRIEQLETETERRADRIDALEAENDRLRECVAAIKDQLGVDTDGDREVVADD